MHGDSSFTEKRLVKAVPLLGLTRSPEAVARCPPAKIRKPTLRERFANFSNVYRFDKNFYRGIVSCSFSSCLLPFPARRRCTRVIFIIATSAGYSPDGDS